MKKSIAITLVLALVLSFAGCGSQNPPATEESVTEVPANEERVTEAPATEAPETEAPTEAVDYGVISYEEFLAAELESEVVFETYVQNRQSWWDNKCTVYCQGPDGAYYLFEMTISQADAERLVPGTKIRVTGDKSQWNGGLEITFAICDILEDADPYIAEPLDATELLGSEELIQHQNKLALFRGMKVESISYKDGVPGEDIKVNMNRDGVSRSFWVKKALTGPESEVYAAAAALQPGDVIDVEGFLCWDWSVAPHITAIRPAES